jgi:DNA-binding transcriptional ArsR family regulator
MDQGSNNSPIDSHFDWTTVLKALADESRLQIISELLKLDTSVQDLSERLDIKMYNISKHLKILENCGLVKKRKDGVHRIYKITDDFRTHFSKDNQVLDLGCCKFIFDSSKT